MAEQTAQSRQNHTRWVPLYHFVMGPIFLVNFILAAYRMVTGFSLRSECWSRWGSSSPSSSCACSPWGPKTV